MRVRGCKKTPTNRQRGACQRLLLSSRGIFCTPKISQVLLKATCWRTPGNSGGPSDRGEQQTQRKCRRTHCAKGDRRVNSLNTGPSTSPYHFQMLEPDYCKARLLEISVGRRFWQSEPSAEDADTFYVRVVEPSSSGNHCSRWQNSYRGGDSRPGGSYEGNQTVRTILINPRFKTILARL
jgi:hypothetical protein